MPKGQLKSIVKQDTAKKLYFSILEIFTVKATLGVDNDEGNKKKPLKSRLRHVEYNSDQFSPPL